MKSQIAEACGADWEVAREGFVRDGRIGTSHTNVPGHDGKKGFGGHCFKDIQAMINFKDIGIEPNTLEGAWQTNLIVNGGLGALKLNIFEFYQG